MKQLVRTMSGSYTQDECKTLGELQEMKEQGTLNEVIRPLETALTEYPQIAITDANRKEISNGQVLPVHPSLKESDKIVYVENNQAVAIYVVHPTKTGLMKPEKMFPKVN